MCLTYTREKEVPWADVATDPTLARTYERECERCNHGECVLVQIRVRVPFLTKLTLCRERTRLHCGSFVQTATTNG
jgi:hypothetical protein